MNEKKIYILRALSKSSEKQVRNTIAGADKKLLELLCECVLNILNGNIKIDKKAVEPFEREMRLLRLKSTSESVRRKTLSSKRGLQLVKTIAKPSYLYLKK